MKKKILIVVAIYYENIARSLLKSAMNKIKTKCTIKVINVPGAFEIPVTIGKNLNKFDGFIALGCVIRGETYHFEVVSNESARALNDLSIKYSLPIGNGILTVENKEQAIERSDPLKLNKGGGAALACLSLIKHKNNISYE